MPLLVLFLSLISINVNATEFDKRFYEEGFIGDEYIFSHEYEMSIRPREESYFFVKKLLPGSAQGSVEMDYQQAVITLSMPSTGHLLKSLSFMCLLKNPTSYLNQKISNA